MAAHGGTDSPTLYGERRVNSGQVESPQITFVDHTAAPGGAELSLARYLEWDKRGVRSNLIIFADGYLREAAESAGIEVIYPNEPLVGLRAQRRWLSQQRQKFAPVLVANSLNSALVMASIRKGSSRYVYYLREDLSHEWLSWKRRLLTVRLALPRFDTLIANSAWTASTVPESLGKKPLHVCYPVCGVGVTSEHEDDDASDGLRLLSLSRLAEWKGIDVVIEAVRLASARTNLPIYLTLAGADLFDKSQYAQRIAEAAARLEPAPLILGHVEDVKPLLATHDVLVHASRRAEPFGQVIVQGLASSLAVVATNAGGPAEVIESGVTGLLVEPGSAESMADAIYSLATDPTMRRDLKFAGRQRAEAFLDEAACSALEDVLLGEIELSVGSHL